MRKVLLLSLLLAGCTTEPPAVPDASGAWYVRGGNPAFTGDLTLNQADRELTGSGRLTVILFLAPHTLAGTVQGSIDPAGELTLTLRDSVNVWTFTGRLEGVRVGDGRVVMSSGMATGTGSWIGVRSGP